MNSRELRGADDRRYVRLLEVTVRCVAWGLVLSALVLGLVLAFGGAPRGSAPSFAVFRGTPGELDTWGALWLVLGGAQFLVLLRRRGWRMTYLGALVHLGAGVLAFAFASSFVFAAFKSTSAGLTGIPTYFAIAFVHMVMSNYLVTLARLERAREGDAR